MPLNSVICLPSAGSKLKHGQVAVSGYALPPGRPGTTVAKVEVSADNARNWTTAEITSPVRTNCWVLWEASVSLPAGARDLIVRATDSRGRTQPASVDWNQKGYLFNAWHRVAVQNG